MLSFGVQKIPFMKKIKRQTEVWEWLLPSDAESFVFKFAIQNVKIKIYGTVILPVVLHGHESWSTTLREECVLRLSENRVLRKIFQPKRNKVIREWKTVHNEELMICTHQILFWSSNQEE